MIFHDPWSLYKKVEDEMDGISRSKLFNEDTYRILRERWCAAVFGIGYEKYIQPCRVAVDESFEARGLDFVLETDGKQFHFQTTEVLEEGRERGREFKEIEKGNMVLRPYRPQRGGQEGPGWIGAAIAKKVEKYYAGEKDLNLLVYVDFHAHDLKFDAIKEKAERYRDAFSSIWLITDTHIASLFPNASLGEIEGGWGMVYVREQVSHHDE